MRAFHEIGQRYATELRPGNVTITGTIGRAYINGALLHADAGRGRVEPPGRQLDASPAFNLSPAPREPAVPGTLSTVTLHDVKIDSWVMTVPEDDFVLEQVGFQALYLSVADEG